MKNDYEICSKQIKETLGILLDIRALDKEDIDKIITVIQGAVSRLNAKIKEKSNALQGL